MYIVRLMKIKNNGFTSLEILIVIAIMAIVFSFSTAIFARRQPLVKLDTVSSELLSVLRQAQNQTITGKNSSAWGVYFNESDYSIYTLYAGSSYQARDELYDLDFDMGDSINWTLEPVTNDIRFSALSSFPLATATIMIKHQDFFDIKEININEVGKIERND